MKRVFIKKLGQNFWPRVIYFSLVCISLICISFFFLTGSQEAPVEFLDKPRLIKEDLKLINPKQLAQENYETRYFLFATDKNKNEYIAAVSIPSGEGDREIMRFIRNKKGVFQFLKKNSGEYLELNPELVAKKIIVPNDKIVIPELLAPESFKIGKLILSTSYATSQHESQLEDYMESFKSSYVDLGKTQKGHVYQILANYDYIEVNDIVSVPARVSFYVLFLPDGTGHEYVFSEFITGPNDYNTDADHHPLAALLKQDYEEIRLNGGCLDFGRSIFTQKRDDFILIATRGSRKYYTVTDPKSPVLAYLYKFYTENHYFQDESTRQDTHVSFEDFVKSNPILIVEELNGEFFIEMRKEFLNYEC